MAKRDFDNGNDILAAIHEMRKALDRMEFSVQGWISDGPVSTALPDGERDAPLPDPFDTMAQPDEAVPQLGWKRQAQGGMIMKDVPPDDDDDRDDDDESSEDGGSGVREPRQPITPLISGGAEAEIETAGA
jgi:hypothetical protein